ncbi:MAG: DNA polymerase III subunit delta, partial [Muribaculaceae bacterium]|nr:DNA polymerase III subunit delta [Muribaculaceae bacterium]
CGYCQRQIRENFIANLKIEQLNYLNPEETAFSRNFSPFINERNVEQLSSLFNKAEEDILANGNGKIIFFDVAVKVILLLKR